MPSPRARAATFTSEAGVHTTLSSGSTSTTITNKAYYHHQLFFGCILICTGSMNESETWSPSMEQELD